MIKSCHSIELPAELVPGLILWVYPGQKQENFKFKSQTGEGPGHRNCHVRRIKKGGDPERNELLIRPHALE